MQANPYIEKWKKDHSDRNALEWIVYFSKNIQRLNKEKGYPLEWNFKSFEDQDPSDKFRDTQDQPEKESGLNEAEDDASTNGSSASQDSQSQEIKPLKPGFTPDGEKIVGKLSKTVYSGYSDLSIITECKFFVEVHLKNRRNQSIYDIELRTEADIGFEAARSYVNDIPKEEQAELVDIPKNQRGQYKQQFQGITGATAQEFETISNKKLPPTYVRGKFKDGAVIKEHFMTRTTLRAILGQKTADQLIQQHYNQYDVTVKEPPWPKFMDWKPARKAIRSGRSRREQEQSESESESEYSYTPNKRGRGRVPRSELQRNSSQNAGEMNLSLEETVSKEVTKAMAQMMLGAHDGVRGPARPARPRTGRYYAGCRHCLVAGCEAETAAMRSTRRGAAASCGLLEHRQLGLGGVAAGTYLKVVKRCRKNLLLASKNINVWQSTPGSHITYATGLITVQQVPGGDPAGTRKYHIWDWRRGRKCRPPYPDIHEVEKHEARSRPGHYHEEENPR
ncbi:hypothetical protein H4I96_12068 [Botrytis cinerea]